MASFVPQIPGLPIPAPRIILPNKTQAQEVFEQAIGVSLLLSFRIEPEMLPRLFADLTKQIDRLTQKVAQVANEKVASSMGPLRALFQGTAPVVSPENPISYIKEKQSFYAINSSDEIDHLVVQVQSTFILKRNGMELKYLGFLDLDVKSLLGEDLAPSVPSHEFPLKEPRIMKICDSLEHFGITKNSWAYKGAIYQIHHGATLMVKISEGPLAYYSTPVGSTIRSFNFEESAILFALAKGAQEDIDQYVRTDLSLTPL